MKRLRFGAEGKVLFKKVRVTLVAVTVDEATFNEFRTLCHDKLGVWDGKDLGGGFHVFLTWT